MKINIVQKFQAYRQCWLFAKKMFQFQRHDKSVTDIFTEISQKHPQTLVYLSDVESWTCKTLEDYSNQVANYFNYKYRKGDVILLHATHCPECTGLWFGLSKLGIITALLNSKLDIHQYKDCFQLSKPKAVICTDDLYSRVKEVSSACIFDVYLLKGKNLNATNLCEELKDVSTQLPEVSNKPGFYDQVLLLYDNENKRAGIINHYRYLQMAMTVALFKDLSPEALRVLSKWNVTSTEMLELLNTNNAFLNHKLFLPESMLPKLFDNIASGTIIY